MKRSILLLPLLVLLAACKPPSEPAGLLPEDERAPQFDKVSEFLDLGGVFYAYMDLTGEAERLGATLDGIVAGVKESNPDVPPLPFDFSGFLAASGISGLDAVGLSSRQMGEDLFHNRSILFFPEGVTGLFALLGEMPHPFDTLDMAPAGSDLVWEMSYRPAALRDSLLEMAGALAGPLGRGGIASQLSLGRPQLGGRTLNQVIDSMGNRLLLIVDLAEDGQEILLDAGMTFPETRAVIGMDGVTDLLLSLRPAVEGQPDLSWTDTPDGFEITSRTAPPPPFDRLDPVLVADTSTGRAFLATSRAYLEECLAGGGKLKDTEAFRQAANLLPPEGVSFTYASPELLEPLRNLFESAFQGQPFPLPEESVSRISGLIFPSLPRPVASVTTVGPEGLYTASNLNTSHRATLASLALQPVAMMGGMSAAMAIPAFQKVRETSRQKAVVNNLRQVAAAGQQFMLEEGTDRATYDDIVPEYIRALTPVGGEDYTGLVVESGGGTLSVTMENGESVEYSY